MARRVRVGFLHVVALVITLAGCSLSWLPTSSPTSVPSSTALVAASSAAPSSVASEPSPSIAWSAAETRLLDGIRTDARVGCVPKRDQLPPRAAAGVECTANTPIVASLDLYLFAGGDDLLAAYRAELAGHGVAMRSGPGCFEGKPAEDAYQPGDSGPQFSLSRQGCFLDELRIANYRGWCPIRRS